MAIARGEQEVSRSTDPPRGAAPTLDLVSGDGRVEPDSGVDEWSSPELNEDGDWVRFEYGDDGRLAFTVFDNRFRVVRSEHRDERVRREVSRGEPRTRDVGGGQCVTEVDVTYQDVVLRGYVLQQHYRFLIVNRTLRWWYGLFDDPIVTLGAPIVGSAGMAAAGHSAGTGAGAAFGGAGAAGGSAVAGIGAAGGVVAALAVGGALFIGVTKFMDFVSGDYEVDHAGWWPLLWYSDRGEPVGEPTTVTELVAVHPCDRPVTESDPHGPIGAIDGSVPSELEPLEIAVGELPFDETDLPHDPDAEADPALLDPGPIPMIEAPVFGGEGDELRWDGFDTDHDWFRDLGVRAGYAFYAEYVNRFRVVRDERFDVTVDEPVPTGELRTRPLGDGRQVVEQEVEIHTRVQAGWRVDLAFQLWRTDSEEIAERYQRARLGLPDGAEPVKATITGAAIEASWQRTFGTWLAKTHPGAAGEGLAAGAKVIGWGAIALAVANMDSKVPVGAGWTPAGFYLIPGDRIPGTPAVRWLPLTDPVPIPATEERFDWDDVLADPDGDDVVVPASPTEDAVRSWRSGEVDVPPRWQTWALRNGWHGPLLGWDITTPAIPGLVQPLDIQLDRWHADPASVPVVWQDWARAHGWLGPVIGWAPGVSQPMPTPNQADRYVIERELTKLGLPVQDLMLISGGSVPGAVYPDHDRRTVAYVALDADGQPVDRRQPYWHRWGQVPVAVLRVELVTGESRDHKRATITVVRMSDRQVVAGARSSPDGTWSDDPYLAVRRAWLRLTDESGMIVENEPSITGHARPVEPGGGGGPGTPAGFVPPPGEGEARVVGLEGDDPSTGCPDCAPEAVAVAEAERAFADLVGLAAGARSDDHPKALRRAATAVRRARRRLDLCRWARCGVTSDDFPEPIPPAADPPHSAAPETGLECGALADEIGRRRVLLDSTGHGHPDIGVDPSVRDVVQAREDLAYLEALLLRVCPPPPAPETGEPIDMADGPDDPCPDCVPERAALAEAEDQLLLIRNRLPREDVRMAEDHARLRAAEAVAGAARDRYDRCRTALCGDQPWDPTYGVDDDRLANYSTRTTSCVRCRGIVRHLAWLNYRLTVVATSSIDQAVGAVLDEIIEYEGYLERCEADCPTEAEPFPAQAIDASCPACAPEAEELAAAQNHLRSMFAPDRRSADPAYLAELHAARVRYSNAWWAHWTCERVVCNPVAKDALPSSVVDALGADSVAAYGAGLDLSCDACLQAASLVILMRRIHAETAARLATERRIMEFMGDTVDGELARVGVEELEEQLAEREELVRFSEDLLERCHRLHCATSPVDGAAALVEDLREPVPPTGGGLPFWAWLMGAVGVIVIVVGGLVLVLGGDDSDDEAAPAPTADAEPAPGDDVGPETDPSPDSEPQADPSPDPEPDDDPSPEPEPTPENAAQQQRFDDTSAAVGLPSGSIIAQPDSGADGIGSNPETAFTDLDGAGIDGHGSALANNQADTNTPLFNASVYGCATVTDRYRVTCAPEAGPMPSGEQLVVVAELDGPAAADTTTTYGLAFDDDGDASDNYPAPQEFEWDLFRDTERWYRMQVAPDGTRSMWAEVWVGTQPLRTYTAAVLIERESHLVWVIPREEVPGPSPAYRATVFRDDGSNGRPGSTGVPDPSTSGGDVSGDDPTSPLTPVDVTAPVDVSIGDDVPADPGPAPQTRLDVDADRQQHLFDVLAERFEAEVVAAVESGDVETLVDLVHPAILGQLGRDACRATLEATVALVDTYRVSGPVTVTDIQGLVGVQAPSEYVYPTGAVPAVDQLLPTFDGRELRWLIACGS